MRSLPQAVRGIAGWVGLGLVLWAALTMGPDTVFPGSAATVPVAGAVLLVAAGMSTSRSGVSRLLSTRPLTYVGRISYAWYLWHWPCLVFARTLTAPTVQPADAPTSALPHGWPVVAAVVVSFALSVVSHRVLEGRCTRRATANGVPSS